jgi:PKD repeat protein
VYYRYVGEKRELRMRLGYATREISLYMCVCTHSRAKMLGKGKRVTQMGTVRSFVIAVGFTVLLFQPAFADVMIDNGRAGTSSTGTWQVSTAPNFFGVDSLWSRNGDTYTWQMSGQPAGTYEVLMWWTSDSSRTGSAPVDIVRSGGTSRIYVNQENNGGKWNSLGTFAFSGSGSVTITASSDRRFKTTCADAVWFKFVPPPNTTPKAAIDSILPNPAIIAQPITFAGHGTDTDGTISAYQWQSNIDGILSAQSGFSRTLSAGTHTISFRVQDDGGAWSMAATQMVTVTAAANAVPAAVIDSILPNPATTAQSITFAGHGTDTDGTISAYQWQSNIDGVLSAQSGFSRTLSAGTHTISFRVQDDGGAWSTAATQMVTVTAAANAIIIDNGAAGTSSTGSWQASGASNFYGVDSLWSRDGATYTWQMSSLPSGTYEVLMWWSPWQSRSTNVAADIVYGGGTQRIYINQQVNGGQWNSLGTFAFNGSGSVTITASNGSTVSTCADAVMFRAVAAANASPAAFIDSINPAVAIAGEAITFVGHGVDTDGAVTAQQWESDIDGILSTAGTFTAALSEGMHTISFKVMDDDGAWSTPVTKTVSVTNSASDFIIDNGGAGTSKTGNWQVSAATGQYGADSLWSRDGATYTWQMSGQPSGTYEVLMWWTQLSTRSGSVAVDIADTTGNTTVNVNQRSDGGKWNSLGFYKFGSTGRVTVTATDSDTRSTSADAVMFRLIAANAVPAAVIDSMTPAKPTIGHAVQFSGHGTDSDGYIVAQKWESDIDGALSTQAVFSRILTQGTHIISYSVMDDQGFWSTAQTRTLSVVDDANEFIIDNSDVASTSSTGTWSASGSSGPYGDDSLWSRNGTTFSWYFTPPRTGSYNLAMWWTAMSSRPTAAAVDVYDADGTHSITVNQRTNGSEWNTVGRYRCNAGTRYQVKITSANGSSVSTCADAVKFTWFLPVEKTEDIYVCQIYSWDELFLPGVVAMLQSLGATRQNSTLWKYRDDFTMTTYNIHMVTSRADAESALKTDGAHVIVGGHSNYGMGPLFVTTDDLRRQHVDDLYYDDDDRFLNISSPMVSLKIDGMVYGQAFPNWRPSHSDGSSALMPYTFAEGRPAYNYYVTYKLPGDPNAYKIELADGSNVERFPDSKVPPWYSPTGTLPDPNVNPEYFIINDDPDFSRCDFIGTWPPTRIGTGYMGEEGYFGYNYQYSPAGTGVNKATYNMFVPVAGSYRVSAAWVPDPANATNATYTINHRDGISTVTVNQQVIAGDWNVLGTYNFDRGLWGITLSDNANGRVIADAMLLEPMDNINNILQAEFTVSLRSGLAPMAVQFTDRSIAMKGTSARLWNFGDGTTSVDQKPVHLYTTPGVYTVSLRVTDGTGAQNTETKTNLIAVGTTASLTAAFTSDTRTGSGRSAIKFIDYSTGSITSRLWNFGDGKTSTEFNPVHTFNNIGPYTVSLTVSGPGGTRTETETNYVYILKPNVYVDNTIHDKTHYMTGTSRPFGKVVIDTRVAKIRTQDLKYKRLFYGTCNSASYYLDVMQHGLVFCTNGDTYHYAGITYLQDYLVGYSDADILADINLIDPVFERIDFTKKPPSLR